MNKKTTLIIILLTICIAALLCLGVLLGRHTGKAMRTHLQISGMLDDLNENIEELDAAFSQAEPNGEFPPDEGNSAIAEAVTESGSPSAETSFAQSEDLSGLILDPELLIVDEETETLLTEEELPPIPKDHHVIFVGDSRTVGMGKAEARRLDECTYVGESGEGYDWFIEDGIDQMDSAIRAWPDAPVIFNLGVNDCDQIASYIDVYREVEKGYPDTDFYYLSVNPVTKDSPHVPLSDVIAFNRQLKAAFPEQYIDSCSWMLRVGFEDVDGVHYSQKQYCAIHDFAVRAVLAG